MAFAPNTKIWLYEGVELDSDYHNTVYFSNEHEEPINAQLAFFGIIGAIDGRYEPLYKGDPSYTGGSVRTVMTYQREDLGYVEVEARCEDIDRCNYMIFTNNEQALKPKFFFAFIERVEYIAEYTSRIYYKIDALQTYMFDYELPVCYVERQHSETDAPYENYVEDVDFGGVISYFDSVDIPLGANTLTPDNGIYGLEFNGAIGTKTSLPFSLYLNFSEAPSGLKYYDEDAIDGEGASAVGSNALAGYNVYYEGWCLMLPFYSNSDTKESFNSGIRFINKGRQLLSTGRSFARLAQFLDENSTKLTSAYIAPTRNTSNSQRMFIKIVDSDSTEWTIGAWNLAYAIEYSDTTFNGPSLPEKNNSEFAFKNNKMLCSPYVKYKLSSPIDSKDFMPQYFNLIPNGQIELKSFIQIYPHYSSYHTMNSPYELSNNIYLNTSTFMFTEGISYNPTNNIIVTQDSYLAWEQENGRAHETKIIGQSINMTFKAAGKTVSNLANPFKLVGENLSVAGDVSTTVANDFATRQSAEDAGDKTIGSVSGNVVNIIADKLFLSTLIIDRETWQRTDDYFTMFGYAQKKLMQPNRRARPYWTYLKTNTTRLKYTNGSIPKEHADEIIRACNRGITWWNGSDDYNAWFSLFDYTQDNSPVSQINEEVINEN